MAGMTNYLRNKIIDWFHRGQAFVPPTTVYFTLVSTPSTAGSAGTPLSGTGYARVGVDSSLVNWAGTQSPASTTASSGTSGQTSNNNVIDFGTAAANWGTATGWEAWDSLTGGNRLFYGTLVNGTGTPSPRTIVTGDPVSFPAAAMVFQWS